MKKLYILRHAKSSWENPLLEDFDRPLNARGKNQLKYMKEFVIKSNISPQLILSSNSKRTRLTKDGIFDKENTIFIDKLYHANSEEIIDTIKNVDKNIDSLMIIGHNPGLNNFVSKLVNFYDNIQTCSLLEIDVNTLLWGKISNNNSKFVSYTNPPKKK